MLGAYSNLLDHRFRWLVMTFHCRFVFAYGKNIIIGPFIHDNMLFGIDADGVLYKTSTKSGGPWTEVENLTKTFKISIIFSKT